ncbi:alpha/beta hydrolase [Williamsia sp. 1138]|uniref:alpha/beta fold hydrolase n=1 Tax=Williamsia sp. 1138 TaxID=1903117 RepID=UPI000A0FBA0B|nr:alpha/beta hydrolase family protein [Williamsia sp. 1138]OZG28525.1 alpha/beta hydrolase [Williamsia sp. 1138]
MTDDIGIRRWGSGNRDAVLIHGLGNSSESWWEVGPALAERGYAVHAVDLPGHGDSIALPSYSVEEMVSAVVAAVPEAPAWTLSLDPRVFDSFRAQKQWAISDLERNHPRWSDGSRARKLAALARWDTAILDDLPDFTPAPIGAPEVPSAVILADPSALVPVERAKQLRELGYTVQSVEGAGHVVHFDDFSGYLRALDEVIDR